MIKVRAISRRCRVTKDTRLTTGLLTGLDAYLTCVENIVNFLLKYFTKHFGAKKFHELFTTLPVAWFQ